MPDVLFLCTGNSCRSQMAEGWLRHLAGDRVNVESAGIEAHGKNPRAISVMREAGVDISTQESTVVNDAMLDRADLVVTVCGHADEQCPVVPRGTEKIHWPLSDPAKAEGKEEEIMEAFRSTRDEVERRVRDLLRTSEVLNIGLSGEASRASSVRRPGAVRPGRTCLFLNVT